LADIAFCFFAGKIELLYSSVILISGLLIAYVALKFEKNNLALVISLISFYVVGLYHTYVIDNIITCYFILMVSPLVCAFILDRLSYKIIVTLISTVLFFVANYLAGIPPFENYFFFFGLYPPVVMLIAYSEKLAKVTNEKNDLINDLKDKNNEIIYYSNMMSHDLKAPLRGINGFANILKENLTDISSEDKELFDYIIKNGKSMSNLIDDILVYSKSSLEVYEFENLNLNNIISELEDLFKFQIQEKNANVVKHNLSTIIANKKTIQLVFQNLISNALKYQPLNSNHIPKILIQQTQDNTNTTITFQDNGIGIAKKQLDSLFKPFQRFHNKSEYEGTGLGLSLVKRIIEKHKGSISAASKEGFSTEFIIKLPINQL